MILAHKIKLDPTSEQEAYFRKAVGTARFTYNWGLAEWKKIQQEGEKPGVLKIKTKFNAIKTEAFPWVFDVTKCAPEGAFMNLGKAFKNFSEGRAKFPKFKKKGRRDSFYLANDKFRVEGDYIKIPKLGWVKMREELRFPGKIMSAVVSCTAGRWFVSISVDVEESLPQCENQASVGVDLGIHTLATLSTGETWENPRALKTQERRLKRLQRQLGKKRKGSKNRVKARQQLANQYYKVACLRQDVTHKLTSSLTQKFQVITIEDLNVTGMLKNHKLAKHIGDANFGEIRRQLTYKSLLYGNTLNVVDRFYPSSKTCSQCDAINPDLTLADRLFVCPVCGFEIDRDLNASINLDKVGTAQPEPTDACGLDGSVSSPIKSGTTLKQPARKKQEAKVCVSTFTHI